MSHFCGSGLFEYRFDLNDSRHGERDSAARYGRRGRGGGSAESHKGGRWETREKDGGSPDDARKR